MPEYTFQEKKLAKKELKNGFNQMYTARINNNLALTFRDLFKSKCNSGVFQCYIDAYAWNYINSHANSFIGDHKFRLYRFLKKNVDKKNRKTKQSNVIKGGGDVIADVTLAKS